MRELSDISERLIEYMAIEKNKSIQGLVLRGRRHMTLYCKMLKKSLHFGTTHTGGMTQAIETNEITYPVAVGLHGARAVAFHPQP